MPKPASSPRWPPSRESSVRASGFPRARARTSCSSAYPVARPARVTSARAREEGRPPSVTSCARGRVRTAEDARSATIRPARVPPQSRARAPRVSRLAPSTRSRSSTHSRTGSGAAASRRITAPARAEADASGSPLPGTSGSSVPGEVTPPNAASSRPRSRAGKAELAARTGRSRRCSAACRSPRSPGAHAVDSTRMPWRSAAAAAKRRRADLPVPGSPLRWITRPSPRDRAVSSAATAVRSRSRPISTVASGPASSQPVCALTTYPLVLPRRTAGASAPAFACACSPPACAFTATPHVVRPHPRPHHAHVPERGRVLIHVSALPEARCPRPPPRRGRGC